MVKSNLHGHTKQIGYPESCTKRKTHRDDIVASANKQKKKEGIYDAYHHPCQSRMAPSKIILISFKVDEAHGAAHQSACQLSPFPLTRRSLFPCDIQLNQSGI